MGHVFVISRVASPHQVYNHRYIRLDWLDKTNSYMDRSPEVDMLLHLKLGQSNQNKMRQINFKLALRPSYISSTDKWKHDF